MDGLWTPDGVIGDRIVLIGTGAHWEEVRHPRKGR